MLTQDEQYRLELLEGENQLKSFHQEKFDVEQSNQTAYNYKNQESVK